MNIEVITYADLKSIEGEPGRFKVKLRKRARSVDLEKCTGCGTCLTACPVTNLPYPKEPLV
jgi:heterodisulfide reductase subunit A